MDDSAPQHREHDAADALIADGALVAAITARVHPDDLLAWSLACRAFNRGRVLHVRRMFLSDTAIETCIPLITRASHYGRSVECASWAYGQGATIRGLRMGAAEAGAVKVLRWSVEAAWRPVGNSERRATCHASGLCFLAARAGSLDALAWLRLHGCEWKADTCAEAARGGNLAVLQWARSQDPPCPWDVWACGYAALGGHLAVLQWARSQDPPCPWDEDTCGQAARGGRLAVLQWARSQDPPCPWGVSTCWEAARGGHLAVLQWARSQEPPCPWDEGTWIRAQGHPEVAQWLRVAGCPGSN